MWWLPGKWLPDSTHKLPMLVDWCLLWMHIWAINPPIVTHECQTPQATGSLCSKVLQWRVSFMDYEKHTLHLGLCFTNKSSIPIDDRTGCRVWETGPTENAGHMTGWSSMPQITNGWGTMEPTPTSLMISARILVVSNQESGRKESQLKTYRAYMQAGWVTTMIVTWHHIWGSCQGEKKCIQGI